VFVLLIGGGSGRVTGFLARWKHETEEKEEEKGPHGFMVRSGGGLTVSLSEGFGTMCRIMRMELIKTFRFEAAHWLPTFAEGHKCRRMHGHSFRVDVCVSGPVDPEKGYLIDYGDIAAAWAPLDGVLDHHLLNEIEGLENPTSEMLAAWIWARLKPSLPMLEAITVHETCTSSCVYRG
jgi:6-pyruvoyltetrahydropterin/6-carboxytetrahydropterin synthase